MPVAWGNHGQIVQDVFRSGTAILLHGIQWPEGPFHGAVHVVLITQFQYDNALRCTIGKTLGRNFVHLHNSQSELGTLADTSLS
jgi:hypothetical protein